MEHIALEIFDKEVRASKYAFLPSNSTIHIRRTSQIFGSGGIWSHSFTLNTHANSHIFGTSGELHGARLHELIDGRRARLWVDGLPLFLGYLKLGDETEVDENGNVTVSLRGGQKTFEEKIANAKANQVPMAEKVLIGMALWQPRKVSCSLKLTASATLSNGKTTESSDVFQGRPPYNGRGGTDFLFTADGEFDEESATAYPKMVFPRGEFDIKVPAKDAVQTGVETIDCINTHQPYDDGHPYCNIALCYQKYDYKRTDIDGRETYDYSGEPEAQRGYEYMPADRVNSAPNFYVLYWIKSLMKHLGIFVEENQMMEVEDMRRLFFVNTNCAYEKPKNLRHGIIDTTYGKYTFRHKKRLIPEYYGPKDNKTGYYGRHMNINMAESRFSTLSFDVGDSPEYDHTKILPEEIPSIERIDVNVKQINDWNEADAIQYEEDNGFLHYAYATKECFPNVNVSEVIDALEKGFGVRFLFNDDYSRVRIVLLRNIFQNETVQTLECDITSISKQENSIRGFRMSYGQTGDTHFYYKGFADLLPHKKELWVDDSDKHDYSKWKLDATYGDLTNKVAAFDKTCFVTPQNGNAYIIKVDNDAKRYRDLHPALFECAAFMDAEDGDCSGEEDTIETINVPFTPIIVNDINSEEERGKRNSDRQQFALFVDNEMRPRRLDLDDGEDYNKPDAYYDVYGKLYAKEGRQYVFGEKMSGDGIIKPGEFSVNSDLYANVEDLRVDLIWHIVKVEWDADSMPEAKTYPVIWEISNMKIDGYVNEGIRLYLQDNFTPNDDGVAPIETHDWGLTLGIMRGSGRGAYVDYSDDPDDDENDTWEIVAGKETTVHADTCDNYGNLWDYNGSEGATKTISTPQEAILAMQEMFPNSNFDLLGRTASSYLTSVYSNINVADNEGKLHTLLLAKRTLDGEAIDIMEVAAYVAQHMMGKTIPQMYAEDADNRRILIEVDGSVERGKTLLALQRTAYAGGPEITIDGGDNGVGVTEGRFSLKLRAEKPNPKFNHSLPESNNNKRYLEIDDPNLRRRGLMDQFYKEYSYWVRNARIATISMKVGLAELIKFDDTVKVKVGDICGFVSEMEYDINTQTGLGSVTMKIMYI